MDGPDADFVLKLNKAASQAQKAAQARHAGFQAELQKMWTDFESARAGAIQEAQQNIESWQTFCNTVVRPNLELAAAIFEKNGCLVRVEYTGLKATLRVVPHELVLHGLDIPFSISFFFGGGSAVSVMHGPPFVHYPLPAQTVQAVQDELLRFSKHITP